jgi:hypothetical protein
MRTPASEPFDAALTAIVPRPALASLWAGSTEMVSSDGIPTKVDVMLSENRWPMTADEMKHAARIPDEPVPPIPCNKANRDVKNPAYALRSAAMLFM